MPKVSRFKRIPLNVAGGSDETRSRAVSIATLKNWYPEASPSGVSAAALMPFPALTVVSNATNADTFYADRGMYVFNGVWYAIKGTYLYKIGPDFAPTVIGVISGESMCDMEDNGEVLVITTGAAVYEYNGITLTHRTDITFGPSVVEYLNGKFIFDSSVGNMYNTNPGTTYVDPANAVAAESNPDDFVRPYVFNQTIYLIGTESIEPWRDVGAGNPPFERESQAIIDGIGCSSKFGVTHTPNFMYFIDRSGTCYRLVAYQVQPVSTPAITYQFQKYNLAKYRARTLEFDRQNFVIFDFFEDRKTWVYSETTDTWFELTSGREQGNWIGGSYVFCYGKHLFADSLAQWFYRLNFDSLLNNGTPIVRQKTFDFMSGEKLGNPRAVYELSRVVFGFETGVGLIEGQGDDPLIGVMRSVDGKTWSQEEFLRLGRSGEFSLQVEWCHMVQFQQIAIRVNLYDPVATTFFSAAMDVREAGR